MMRIEKLGASVDDFISKTWGLVRLAEVEDCCYWDRRGDVVMAQVSEAKLDSFYNFCKSMDLSHRYMQGFSGSDELEHHFFLVNPKSYVRGGSGAPRRRLED